MKAFYILTIILSGSLSFLFVNIIKKLAIEYGFHDIPEKRKIHSEKVPTMGGIGLFGATWITMIVLNASGFIEADSSTLRLLSTSTLFFVVGLIDDIKEISAKSKFIIQIVSGIFFFIWNKNDLAILFNNIIFTNITLSILSGILFAVIINSINFVDGLDGLCGGISLILSSVLLFYSIIAGKTYLIFLLLSLIGSIISFLFFNFYPAKIFMGNTGSLFLGSMFSMILMLLSYHITESWYAFVILFTYPLLDISLAVIRRFITKRSLFAPDKNHIHHILIGSRTKYKDVVLLIYMINIIFAAFSIIAFLFPNIVIFVFYGIFTAAFFCYALYNMLKNYKKEENAAWK